jgi:hypothetical protein
MADAGFCMTSSLGCPDLVFSPGATRTIEGLKACAATYKTLPCDQVLAEKVPSCVTPGTRAQGQACIFSSQCSSLDCRTTSNGCNQCAKEVGLHESCDAPDLACSWGTSCVGSPQTCEPDERAPLGPNEACVRGSVCMEGYFCNASAQAGVCTALPKEGERCASSLCARSTYCSSDFTCKILPGMGEPCGLASSVPPKPMFCQPGLVCHYGATSQSGTCLPPPVAGEPCVFDPDAPQYKTCGEGLHCDEATSPALCAAPEKAGAACTSDAACEPGSLCACPPSTPDCQDRHCQIARFAGERCDEPNTMCHPAFSCDAGICKPIPLRGLFGQTCPGQ